MVLKALHEPLVMMRMHAFPSCTLLIHKKSTYMEENGGCFEHAGIEHTNTW